MPWIVTAYFCGTLLLLLFSSLPHSGWLCFIICGGMILLYRVSGYWKFFLRIAVAIVAGYLWSFFAADAILSARLPHALEGRTLSISGEVISLPVLAKHYESFIFLTEYIAGRKAKIRLHLSMQRDAGKQRLVHAGERWNFYVRLKRIHGLRNPGSIDDEVIAFQQKLGGKGYIVKGMPARKLMDKAYQDLFGHFREKIRGRILQQLAPDHASGWIIALATGDRSKITEADWEVLRRTGTNHLLAIAGLHEGFLASFIFYLVWRIWRLSSSLCLKLPARQAAKLASLFAIWSYAGLSGFSLPAQRACIMLSVFFVSGLMCRYLRPWHGFFVALFFVTLFQPFAVLGESFWLSFGAVAIIIFSRHHFKGRGYFSHLVKIQLILTVGLLPFTILFFGQVSLVSLPANLIAVPVMGFIILPLVFSGTVVAMLPQFFSSVAKWLFWGADGITTWLWKYLHWLAAMQHVVLFFPGVHPVLLLLAFIGVLVAVGCRRYPGSLAGCMLILPVFLPGVSSGVAVPARGNAWLTVLDIGQGLSATVETRHHLLVFDAGPKFNRHDAGEEIIKPFLAMRGIKNIDMLVVSHGDNDHAGGVAALLENFSVRKLVSSVPEKMPGKSAVFCLAHQTWRWDGVKFEFLYPGRENLGQGNNSSCVLMITAASGQRLLLTGDIEKNAEHILAKGHDPLHADILLAPHHGSKTSANSDFVAQVHPLYVIFSAGYHNRYHFPHPVVENVWRAQGSRLLVTNQTGAIFFDLGNARLMPRCYRMTHWHFWNDRL